MFENTVRTIFGAWLVAVLLTFAGCAAPQQTQQTTEELPDIVEMRVVQVDQYTRLGDKKADGQYVVARIMLKNVSSESIMMSPAQWKLKNVAGPEEDQYSQPPERGMTPGFVKVYGAENKDKVVDYAASTIHPQLEVERYLVFLLPRNATLEDYVLVYTPPGGGGASPFGGGGAAGKKPGEARLAGPDSLVNDYRR